MILSLRAFAQGSRTSWAAGEAVQYLNLQAKDLQVQAKRRDR